MVMQLAIYDEYPWRSKMGDAPRIADSAGSREGNNDTNNCAQSFGTVHKGLGRTS